MLAERLSNLLSAFVYSPRLLLYPLKVSLILNVSIHDYARPKGTPCRVLVLFSAIVTVLLRLHIVDDS